MTTANLTDKDVQVRDSVMRQLEWDPEVDASAIGVTAKNGTVTLTGFINTYAGKLAAERAAKRIRGVRAIANDIEVRLKAGKTDPDIAADVAAALRLRTGIPESVQAVVHHGVVTLTGNVYWPYQKHAAEKAARHVEGVRAIHDLIAIAPKAPERDLRRRIAQALYRNANIDSRTIKVTVSGNTARLTGIASTWLQREAAERAAADAPGIMHVDNHIVVDPIGFSDEDDCEIC